MEKKLGVQTFDGQKDCAALAIGCGIPIGAALMVYIGAGNDSAQMLRMYCCIAATFFIILALYRSFCRLCRVSPMIQSACFSEKTGAFFAFIVLAILLYTLLAWKIFAGYDMRVSGTGGSIAFCFLTLLLAVLYMNGIKQSPAFIGEFLFYLTCVFSYFIMFLYSYAPNIINQNDYVLHHYTAVTQSIYNVAYNVPYTLSTSGVYGHYAMFLWPLLKLFGHTPQAIAIMLAALNCVVLVLLIAFTLKMVKNSFLRSLTILAAVANFTSSVIYAATWPLRVLWPLLILVYVTYGHELVKNKKHFVIVGYILCSLAVTWQIDSGLVTTAAYTIFLWLFMWKTEAVFSAKAFKVYGLSILGAAGSVFGMVVLVNLYNILCGGPLVFQSCFFPLVAGDGYAENLQTNLRQYGYNWLIPICTFIVSIAVGLLSSSFLKVSNDSHKINLAICAVMGIGQSFYYLNRSIAGWACVYFYLILCLAYLTEDGLTSKLNRDSVYSMLKYTVGACGMLYLCVFALNCMLSAPDAFRIKLDTNINTVDSMAEISEEINASIPKDTYAFGYYTQEVYAYMGWDPGYHHRDASDFFGALESIHEEIRQQDAILVSAYNLELIEADLEDWTTVLAIPEESPIFYYVVKAPQ